MVTRKIPIILGGGNVDSFGWTLVTAEEGCLTWGMGSPARLCTVRGHRRSRAAVMCAGLG